jgi:predicted RNA-binding Zn ribbon-like protein
MPQDEMTLHSPFIGNSSCLDFVNTIYNDNGAQVDRLKSFIDLIHWLNEAQLIDVEQMNGAWMRWGDSTEGKHVLKEACEFRKDLRDMIEHYISEGSILLKSVEGINRYLLIDSEYSKLQQVGEGAYALQTYRPLKEPLQLLSPIAASAAQLVVAGGLLHVKSCSNPHCILYFYDNSKNHSRRWCSMDSCGNRDKAAKHYRRHRGAKGL